MSFPQRFLLPFVLALLFCASAAAHEWTDTNGNKVKARFVGFNKRTGQVILMAAGRRRIVVDYYQLIERDRRYVRSKLAAKGRLSELIQFERQSQKVGKTPATSGSGEESSTSGSATNGSQGDTSSEQQRGRPISSPRSLWILANGRTLRARAIELRGEQVVMMDQTGRRGTIPLSEFLPPDQVYLRRAASGLDQPASSRTGMPRGALPTPTPEMGEEDLGAPPAVPVEQFADAMGPGAPAIAAPRWGDATSMRQASAVNDRALEWGREERERAARRQAEAMRQVREMQEQQMEAFTEPSAPVIDGDWPEKERQEPTGSMEASPYTAKMDEGMPASQAIMELQDDTLVCDNCKSTFSSRDYKVGDPCPKCNHMTTIKRVRAIKGLVYLILLFGGGIAALVRRMTG